MLRSALRAGMPKLHCSGSLRGQGRCLPLRCDDAGLDLALCRALRALQSIIWLTYCELRKLPKPALGLGNLRSRETPQGETPTMNKCPAIRLPSVCRG